MLVAVVDDHRCFAKARTTNEPWSHNANTFPRNTWHIPVVGQFFVVYMAIPNLLTNPIGKNIPKPMTSCLLGSRLPSARESCWSATFQPIESCPGRLQEKQSRQCSLLRMWLASSQSNGVVTFHLETLHKHGSSQNPQPDSYHQFPTFTSSWVSWMPLVIRVSSVSVAMKSSSRHTGAMFVLQLTMLTCNYVGTTRTWCKLCLFNVKAKLQLWKFIVSS